MNCIGLKAMVWWVIVIVLTLTMLISYICLVAWKLMWFRFDINKIREACKPKEGYMSYPSDSVEMFRAQYM